MKGKFGYRMSVKLYGDSKAFGPGIAALLRNVEKTGSLQKASAAMNMAYSKAWRILKETEKEWGIALTARETGGRDGGGSTLTPEAVEILEHYEAFMMETRREADRLFEQYFSPQWINELEKKGGRSHEIG